MTLSENSTFVEDNSYGGKLSYLFRIRFFCKTKPMFIYMLMANENTGHMHFFF